MAREGWSAPKAQEDLHDTVVAVLRREEQRGAAFFPGLVALGMQLAERFDDLQEVCG